MRILLTGGSGLVGHNILEHPSASIHEIIAPASSELNLLDYDAVREYLISNQPDMIIHSAGLVGGIQANIAHPVDFLVRNFDMGRNLIIASRNSGIRKVINLGSSCMYPRNASNPLSEHQILAGELEPTNEGYALAKIAVAKLCEYINREESSFQYKTVIPCNLYGRWDKFEPHHAHLIPSIIDKLHKAKVNGYETVEIWGDGNARREFMYAGDLADFLFAGINNFDVLPTMINVGLGFDYSVNEYYSVCAEIVGFKGRFVHDLTKPVGMQQKLLNISKQLEFGWRSTTSLFDGVRATYRFYIENNVS